MSERQHADTVVSQRCVLCGAIVEWIPVTPTAGPTTFVVLHVGTGGVYCEHSDGDEEPK